jgi:glycosyltransferase involved in cell wall biosynthesis
LTEPQRHGAHSELASDTTVTRDTAVTPLVASPIYPHPPNRGDKLRWQALLTRLGALMPLSAVFGFTPSRDVRNDAFERSFQSLQIVPVHVLRIAWTMASLQLRGQPSVFGRLATPGWRSRVLAATSPGSPVLLLGPSASAVPELPSPALLDLIDVKSRVRTVGGDRVEKGLLSSELSFARRFHVVLACEDDRDWLVRHGADETRLVVIHNGVEPRFFTAARHPTPGLLVFVGNFLYEPNREALSWFLRHCWPALQADRNGVSLRVVGYGADRLARREPAIEISAMGVQNKVIEAMAAGLPVVCTSPVSRGLSDGHPAIVADERETFISACRTLLADEARREELGKRGRDYALRSHDWMTSARLLRDVLASAH